MKRFLTLLIAVVSVSLFASAAQATVIYNPQADFSSTNPSGVWSYATINTNNTGFTLLSPYSAANDQPGVHSWGGFPGIFDNTNSSTTTIYSTISIPANTLMLHPDNSSTDQTDLRFTAPTNMVISNISASYSAASNATPTSSDVHVYVNGVSQFDSVVSANYPNGTTSFSSITPYVLLAGQTIEFRVGDGGNGYSFDGTNLVASITAVPEPSSIALLCLGGLTLVGVQIKRLRRKV